MQNETPKPEETNITPPNTGDVSVQEAAQAAQAVIGSAPASPEPAPVAEVSQNLSNTAPDTPAVNAPAIIDAGQQRVQQEVQSTPQTDEVPPATSAQATVEVTDDVPVPESVPVPPAEVADEPSRGGFTGVSSINSWRNAALPGNLTPTPYPGTEQTTPPAEQTAAETEPAQPPAEQQQ